MALCIIIELAEKKPRWKVHHKAVQACSNLYFEFFPIPDDGKRDKSCIGVSVLNKTIPAEEKTRFKQVLKRFVSDGHTVVELYSSTALTDGNMDGVLDKLL